MIFREMLALVSDLLVKGLDLSFLCVGNLRMVQISWGLKSQGYSFQS